MEMLIMCYACKSNSCGKVIGVIPYLPYSAQSKWGKTWKKAMNVFASFSYVIHLQKNSIWWLYFHYIFRDINNTVMEMLIMAYACKTSTSRKIVGVIPYLPYSRQCKIQNTWLYFRVFISLYFIRIWYLILIENGM